MKDFFKNGLNKSLKNPHGNDQGVVKAAGRNVFFAGEISSHHHHYHNVSVDDKPKVASHDHYVFIRRPRKTKIP